MADRNPEYFFELHKKAWVSKWDNGAIEISGDRHLQKLAYSSFYYLLSSLPSTASRRAVNDFGGISAGGLANGGESEPDRGNSHHRASYQIMCSATV